MSDIRVAVYIDAAGRSAFTRWFEELNPKDGEKLVVLLGGSAKSRQQQAIQAARQSWK